jgi:hypothetical protein
MKTGSCLCGALRYEFDEPARAVIACHCSQCRKQSGSFVHATSVDDACFRIRKGETLKWYRSSDFAQRGFCTECGSALFWKPDKGGYTSFSAGSIDGATGLTIEGHIYCDFKGDYYEVPENEGYQKKEWKS